MEGCSLLIVNPFAVCSPRKRMKQDSGQCVGLERRQNSLAQTAILGHRGQVPNDLKSQYMFAPTSKPITASDRESFVPSVQNPVVTSTNLQCTTDAAVPFWNAESRG